jgi:predicted HNH restriction endonuclease
MLKEVRDKLKAMSLELYGASSKWNKLLNQPEIIIEETEHNGVKVKTKTTKYHTVDELIQEMEKAIETKRIENTRKEENERRVREARLAKGIPTGDATGESAD